MFEPHFPLGFAENDLPVFFFRGFLDLLVPDILVLAVHDAECFLGYLLGLFSLPDEKHVLQRGVMLLLVDGADHHFAVILEEVVKLFAPILELLPQLALFQDGSQFPLDDHDGLQLPGCCDGRVVRVH